MNLSDYTERKNTATPHETEVNWNSYPYNSNDVQTLKNRASKVKERVLTCTTSNQLNELLFFRKANELELNWLVGNYFTEAERAQLRQIQGSTQGNLFSNTEEPNVIRYEYREVVAQIDKEMERLGWSIEDGKKYLGDRALSKE